MVSPAEDANCEGCGCVQPLVFYFALDCRSSYLAMSQVLQLQARYGVEFEWVALPSGRLRSTGQISAAAANDTSMQPANAQNIVHEAAQWAAYYGIAYIEPEHLGFDVEPLLLAMAAAHELGLAADSALILARSVFVEGGAPVTTELMQRLLEAQPLLAEALAAAEPPGAQRLQRLIARAEAQGVWRLPALGVGDAVFSGHESVPLVAHQLAARAASSGLFRVVGLDHVVIRTMDPQRLVAFYCELLQARVEREVQGQLWQIRVGDGLLDIARATEAVSVEANMDHFCLRIEPYNESAILGHLERQGVTARAAGTIYGAQGFGRSIYLQDPDGNRVELKGQRV